jgi:hypothetical protein
VEGSHDEATPDVAPQEEFTPPGKAEAKSSVDLFAIATG